MFSRISSFFAPAKPAPELKERLTTDTSCREFGYLTEYFVMQCPLIALINRGEVDPKTGCTVEYMMNTFVQKLTAVANSRADLTDQQIAQLISYNKDLTTFCNKTLERVTDDEYALKIHLLKDQFNVQLKRIIPDFTLETLAKEQPTIAPGFKR